ncbi:SlyX family protein [Bdellovibrio bacteriovorus]|uniref:SlyX family protein n=1 Tax=Bdellovibrio bacteriovorus TaxID=959 RepID=UPI003AA84885
MSEDRFVDLEIKLTHQEQKLEELHQVLYEQQKTIDKLETLLQGLTSRLKELLGSEGDEIRGNEKPPHY